METRAKNRSVRALWLLVVVIASLALASLAAAQDAPAAEQSPAATTSGTLTLGVTTNPPGGQGFRLTAVTFQTSWGQSGTGPGQFRQPRDVAVDSAGNFYISDHRNSRVTKLGPNGNFIAKIGRRGRQQGEILRPNAIDVMGDQLIVTDTDNNRMVMYNTNGGFVRQWGSQGGGNGQFRLPNGVAFGPDGNIYVADTWNHRIQVFTPQGAYLRQWGALGSGDGQFRFPAHLDFGPGGDLYVADSNNNRIQVFNSSGTFLRKFGTVGTGVQQFYLPVGIDMADDGFLYVADMGNDRLLKLTSAGQFVAQWSQVQGGSTISRPNGLLVVDGTVYASDIDANRIQIFSQGTLTLAHGQQQSLTLPAGAYNVTQAPRAGWTFGSATCNGGSPSPIAGGVRVTLADGAAVTCGFVSNQ